MTGEGQVGWDVPARFGFLAGEHLYLLLPTPCYHLRGAGQNAEFSGFRWITAGARFQGIRL